MTYRTCVCRLCTLASPEGRCSRHTRIPALCRSFSLFASRFFAESCLTRCRMKGACIIRIFVGELTLAPQFLQPGMHPAHAMPVPVPGGPRPFFHAQHQQPSYPPPGPHYVPGTPPKSRSWDTTGNFDPCMRELSLHAPLEGTLEGYPHGS